MLPIDARRLDQVHARLSESSTRLVGWGSGSVFDYFQERFPLPLSYLVDNDASRWGSTRGGVPIDTPSRLLCEDHQLTVVIIYSSAWQEIQCQLESLGAGLAAPASAVFADTRTRERLARADEIAARPRAARRPSYARSIVVQGPVWPSVTEQVLRVFTALNPDDAVVLSTWEDTDLDLLTAVGAVADDVVLSPRPRAAGVQNRNAQIVSTSAGIHRAIEAGASSILKTRTDLALVVPTVFDRASSWLATVESSAARAAGLRERIIVPSSFTRKFLLYHPSDLVMLGAADDLRRYWSAPLDARTGELLSPQWIDRPLSAVNMEGNPTESYLGLQFCRTLGRSASGSVRDSWHFYRDFFAVVDNDWLEMLWFKNLSIPDASVREGVRQMVTQAFWERLQAGDAGVEADLLEIDVDRVALRSLAAA
ncbi:MAG: WavE lipopolysaccharide synthesis family protein [Vicinamibacterales bacterium]